MEHYNRDLTESTLLVDFAREEDYPAMKQIWTACFGDPLDYVQFFFEHCLPRHRALTAYVNGDAAGCVYLLSAKAKDGNTFRPAIYIYALGVLPAYRSRGIGQMLIRRVFAIAESEGAICFLRPASADLVPYYERFGMQKTYLVKECRLIPDPHKSTADSTISSVSAKEYAHLRTDLPAVSGLIQWDFPHISFAIAENDLSGGRCLKYTKAGRTACVFMKREKDGYCITEVLPYADASFLSGLCAHFPDNTIYLRLQAAAEDPGSFVLGMTYNTMHQPENAPLGLLLD